MRILSTTLLSALAVLMAARTRTSSAFAFTIHSSQHVHIHTQNIHTQTFQYEYALKMSDQWDDEEIPVTTYDDATMGIIEESDAEELESLGGYEDMVPGSETSSQENVRDAIRSRTGTLGMEEAQVSKEFLAEAASRAAMRQGNGPSSPLDLTKVSDGSAQMLSINYDPEDEMTEEEMKQADSLGYQPLFEQLIYELQQTTFPDLLTTFTRVVLLVFVAFTTGFFIIQTDIQVREFMMVKKFIPRPEDILNAKDAGLALSQELAKRAAESKGLSLPDIGL